MAISQHTTSRALQAPPFYPEESQGATKQFQVHVDAPVPSLNLTAGMVLLMDPALEPSDGDVVLVSIKSRPQEGQLIGQVVPNVGGGMGVTVAYHGQRRSAGSLDGVNVLGVMAGSFQPRRGGKSSRDKNRPHESPCGSMKEVAHG